MRDEPVVQHAPDVAEDDVIIRGDLGEARNDGDGTAEDLRFDHDVPRLRPEVRA
jgi:hypothetical protein